MLMHYYPQFTCSAICSLSRQFYIILDLCTAFCGVFRFFAYNSFLPNGRREFCGRVFSGCHLQQPKENWTNKWLGFLCWLQRLIRLHFIHCARWNNSRGCLEHIRQNERQSKRSEEASNLHRSSKIYTDELRAASLEQLAHIVAN